MLTERPCGACGELVPADTGCKHWKPSTSLRTAASERHKREARTERKKVPSRRQALAEREAAVESFRAELERAGYYREAGTLP